MTSNKLGQFLRYFSEAWLVAAEPWMAKAAPANAQTSWAASLDTMGQRQPRKAPEDNDQAYRLAMTSAWVYSDLKLLSDRSAADDAMPKVQQRQEDIPGHPLHELLRKPNSLMSGQFFRRYTMQWFNLQGNAYWVLGTPRPGVGPILELWPVPANVTAPQPATLREGVGAFKGKQVVDFLTVIDGEERWLPGENVVHFRMPNPFDYWVGLSPLTAAMLAMQSDEAQQAWVRDFYKEDGAIPSAVISLSETISPDEFHDTVRRIKAQLAAGERRMFTRSGDLSVAVISQTLEQMQIIQSREFTRDEIDRIFGVPAGLMSAGLSGDSRLATDIAFGRNTLQPLVDYQADQINTDMLPYYDPDGSQGLQVAAPDMVPADKALEVQEYTIYSQDRSINENRQRRGLDEWQAPEGMQELDAWADVPVRLIDVAKAKMVRTMTQPPPQADVGSLPGSDDPEALTDNQAGKAALDLELKRWRKVASRSLQRQGDALAREFESEIIPAEVRKAITDRLQGASSDEEVTAAFAAPFFRHDWTGYP